MLSAYRDNAAVMEGCAGRRASASTADASTREHDEHVHILMKCRDPQSSDRHLTLPRRLHRLRR